MSAVSEPHDALEQPRSINELYLARSRDEVVDARPFMTGDVFEGVTIPGTPDTSLGMILTHPCSMRSGGHLAKHLLLARVDVSPSIGLDAWPDGNYKVMLLPELLGKHHSALFLRVNSVKSSALSDATRVACLTPAGVNLLQQRLVFHLTRYVIPTHELSKLTAAIFDEADLQEVWVESAVASDGDPQIAAQEFHEWIRATDESGAMRQDHLGDPQRRAGVQREMQQHLLAN